MLLRAAFLSLTLPLAAFAQDREGRDTPGEWVVDHFESFGLWDVACDHRMTGEVREERCYIRYVDVFSPHPDFGAQFLFVTPGPEVEIGIEPGTLFAPGGMRIEGGDGVMWSTDRIRCLTGLGCRFADAEAKALLKAMATGGTFAFDFTDRHGAGQSLRWDLSPFAAALSAFETERDRRGL